MQLIHEADVFDISNHFLYICTRIIKLVSRLFSYGHFDIPHDVTAWTLSDSINSDCLDKRGQRV